jgi:phage-related protein
VTRPWRPAGEKPLHWVGASRKDLLAFSADVVSSVGYALGVVQFGGRPPTAKPWKGLGPGVLEIVEGDASGTYRAVYTVRFTQAIYVLHVFQKKSPSGIRTARTDVRLIEDRLKLARDDYEVRYGGQAEGDRRG